MSLLDNTVLFGLLSCFFSAIGIVPYVYSILKGETKPHAFSWLLWGLTMVIAGTAQVLDSAGPGSWAMLIGSFLSFCIFALSLKYGEKDITRSDWIALGFGLSAIPLWMATDNPLWSVILVTTIDTVAYAPTVRKCWRKPNEEDLKVYYIAMTWQGLSLLALNNFTWITALAPATFLTVNTLFTTYVLIRRQILERKVVCGV